MKKYRVLVMAIVLFGVVVISKSNPIDNLGKATNLIYNKINNDDKDKEIDKIKICIDPGHQAKGNPNPEPTAPGSGYQKAKVSSGATGVATKKPEYVLNLEASIVLKHILEGKGYDVIMTRETHDVDISNAQRAILANEKEANMVIRIHADSLNDSSKTGASILIPAKESKYTSGIYEESNNCAQIVKEKLVESNIKVNGIFERNDLTGFNWSKVPVVLVEMGFLSNYSEDQMMSNPEYQRKLMQSVADGVEEYFKTK